VIFLDFHHFPYRYWVVSNGLPEPLFRLNFGHWHVFLVFSGNFTSSTLMGQRVWWALSEHQYLFLNISRVRLYEESDFQSHLGHWLVFRLFLW
jgi:hypothetical protein